MGKRKRILGVGECVCLCFVLLTGCGEEQVAEQSEVTQESSQTIEESQTPKVQKTKIVLRGPEFDETIKECVQLFNDQNEKYVVELDINKDEEYRFWQETYEELSNGLGADIFTVNSLSDAYELANAGILTDLKPYLEGSGIKEEDYFPFAFNGWREGDKIYGVNVSVQPEGCWVDADFLGEEPYTIESVLANMQKTPKSVFREYSSWERDLTYCLSGSDDLWGMIDEENGTCNLQTELLKQLIETFINHSFYGRGNVPVVAGALMDTYWYKFVSEEELKKEGKVRIGYFCDDGLRSIASLDNMFLVNANSSNAEGAWEFLDFLLGEQAQSLMMYDRYPVNRAVFEQLMAHEIEEGAVMDGEEVVLKAGNQRYYEENGADAYRARFDLTEEKIAEIRSIGENTKATSLKTAAIIKIVAEDYRLYLLTDMPVEEFVAEEEAKVKRYLEQMQ